MIRDLECRIHVSVYFSVQDFFFLGQVELKQPYLFFARNKKESPSASPSTALDLQWLLHMPRAGLVLGPRVVDPSP